MKITDTDKLKKRLERKRHSDQLARDLLSAFNDIGLKDSNVKRRIQRLLNCCSKMIVFSNDVIRTWFCGQKICRLCNSIRMAKLLGIYKDQIESYEYTYHLTLTMENAYFEYATKDIDKIINYRNFVSTRIDDMFKFWHNSIMCKTDLYKSLSKTVHFIRSWEVTFNSVKSLHPHFHLLLVSNSKEDIETLGNFIINHWIMWWKRKKIDCVRYAQRLEPIRKTIMENFKYCLKIADIKGSNATKIIELIKVTDNRRLFTQRGFKSELELRNINSRSISDIEDNKVDDIKGAIKQNLFLYDYKLGGFYSKATGEVIDSNIGNN
jgi:plasmid rolling circle replication initiator protein Rep